MEPRDDGTMRQYSSGATRSSGKGKPSYCSYTSVLATRRYGQYMLEHETQADGEKRPPDNWKSGLEIKDTKESMGRHWEHVKTILDGHTAIDDHGKEVDIEDALCAMMFNVTSMLHEVLKK